MATRQPSLMLLVGIVSALIVLVVVLFIMLHEG